MASRRSFILGFARGRAEAPDHRVMGKRHSMNRNCRTVSPMPNADSAAGDDPNSPTPYSEDLTHAIPSNLVRSERFQNASHGVFANTPTARCKSSATSLRVKPPAS